MEIMKPIDDQHSHERANTADQGKCRPPYEGECAYDRDLRERVIGRIVSNGSVGYLDKPPRQWRQLVITELPFPAIGERFDEIDRQIVIKERGQNGPNHKMQDAKSRESAPGIARNRGEKSVVHGAQALGLSGGFGHSMHVDQSRRANTVISLSHWETAALEFAGSDDVPGRPLRVQLRVHRHAD